MDDNHLFTYQFYVSIFYYCCRIPSFIQFQNCLKLSSSTLRHKKRRRNYKTCKRFIKSSLVIMKTSYLFILFLCFPFLLLPFFEFSFFDSFHFPILLQSRIGVGTFGRVSVTSSRGRWMGRLFNVIPVGRRKRVLFPWWSVSRSKWQSLALEIITERTYTLEHQNFHESIEGGWSDIEMDHTHRSLQ